MTGSRDSTASVRATIAVALALLLALRLLSPAGFMPSFDHGAVTIVACPDGAGGSAMADHHHDHSNAKAHQACPYASASALGGLTGDTPLLPAMLAVGVALLLGRAFAFLDKQRAHERPPLRAPPIPD